MAKYESQSSRAAAALAEDEEFVELFRPERGTRARASQPLPLREEPGARVGAPTRSVAEGSDEEFALRTRRRVPAKRTLLPQTRAGRILLGACVLLALAAVLAAVYAIRHFFEHDPRFRIDSASAIQIAGNSQVTRGELLAVFGDDIGRNIFFVPMKVRRAELESLPWVEHATVMRLLPNQLRIAIAERTPVAFVREGNRIGLVDASGVILRMPPAMMAAKHYSFPVITGISTGGDAELRAQRMALYERFVSALDSAASHASAHLSEVDISDPEDVRAVLPDAGGDILVHFGDTDFGNRYAAFEDHLAGWKQQYPHLAAVDLRYQHQTVLEMAKGNADTSSDTPAPQAMPRAAHPASHAATPRPGEATRNAGHAGRRAALIHGHRGSIRARGSRSRALGTRG